MKRLLGGWRSAALSLLVVSVSTATACALGAAALTACSASPTSIEPGGGEEDNLEILFPKMYSAFDGTHEFKIPAIVDGVKKITWTASDPEMVDLDTQSDGSVILTVRKAGTVTIKAKSGSLSGTASLVVTQATPEDWQFGSDRYNNGITWKQRGDGGTSGGGGGDGGGGSGDGDGGGGGRPQPNKQLACTNCHANGGQDVEHTPMQTGGYSDAELVAIFSEGRKPAGSEQRIMPADKWSKIHTWTMSEDEKKGLITYLRALEPKSQGPVDFGGRGGRGGGGKGKKDGGTPPTDDTDGGAATE